MISPWHYHQKAYFTLIQKGGNVEKKKNKSTECIPGNLFFYNSDEIHCNEQGQNHSKNFNIEIEDAWFDKHDIDKNKINGIIFISNLQVRASFIKIVQETIFKDSHSRLAIEGIYCKYSLTY